MSSVIDTLDSRGFIMQVTDEAIRSLAPDESSVYAGFDPTASSLHVGHLVPIMAMTHFQRAGYRAIMLIGGATGMVGDPSGKSAERNLLTPDQVHENALALKKQMSLFLDFSGPNSAVLVDNNDWIASMSFIDWLREVGKYFTVNYMIAKESVQRRLESENGISFTEFSYMTMQAYDFLYLRDKYNCRMQCGGNDQWGNITAGTDLVRKVKGSAVYGLTFPLLSMASGEKFGKTAEGSVWLDPARTSPYNFYQYWVRVGDADIDRFLKLFTFLALPQIEEICREHSRNPERRHGQQVLASEVTRMVHGEEALSRVKRACEALFGGDLAGLTIEELREVFSDVPSTTISTGNFLRGMKLQELLVQTGLVTSKGEARRLMQQGGAYVNNLRVSDEDAVIGVEGLLSNSMLVLRAGKKSYHLVLVL